MGRFAWIAVALVLLTAAPTAQAIVHAAKDAAKAAAEDAAKAAGAKGAEVNGLRIESKVGDR